VASPYFIRFSPIALKKQMIFFDVEVEIPKFGILAPPLHDSSVLDSNFHARTQTTKVGGSERRGSRIEIAQRLRRRPAGENPEGWY
jgi:hypothetical protein